MQVTQGTGGDITEAYQRQADTVYRVCLMLLKNPADAEDATQTTFLKLIKSGKEFADIEHEKAFLIVTAQNECKNLLRHWWRKKRSADLPDEEGKEDVHDEILSEVLALPEKYRLPLLLFYYEGYGTREIAGMLKTKDATIRTRLRVARELLKLSIGGERDD